MEYLLCNYELFFLLLLAKTNLIFVKNLSIYRYTIPTGVSDIELVHSLSIAQNPITSVVFNNNANWLW